MWTSGEGVPGTTEGSAPALWPRPTGKGGQGPPRPVTLPERVVPGCTARWALNVLAPSCLSQPAALGRIQNSSDAESHDLGRAERTSELDGSATSRFGVLRRGHRELLVRAVPGRLCPAAGRGLP